MENNNEMTNNANVNNEAAENQNQQPQEKKDDKKEKQVVTWTLGPVSINLNPKVAKFVKGVGIGIGAIGAVALGSKIGASGRGKKDHAVIDSQAAEISRLNALLDEAPKMIESTVETAAEIIPEAVPETISTED